TTVESTRYRRSGKLISPAGCCEKRGLTGQRQRTIKRFFPWIGHRYGRSNSYASLVRVDSGSGKRSRVRPPGQQETHPHPFRGTAARGAEDRTCYRRIICGE